MTKTPAEVVREFLNAYMSGDIDRARALASDDFSFRAAAHDAHGDKKAYFAGAERKTSYIRDFRILRQLEDGDEVSTLYEIDIETSKGAATMPINEWHVVSNGQIVSTFMVFDSSGKPAELMREALRSPE